MTNRFTTLAAAAALFIGLSAPAAADMTSLGAVGPWQIAADAEVCQAVAPYKNGTQLYFFINANGALVLGVARPNWAIPAGNYQVSVGVDTTERRSHTAKAADGWIVWEIAASQDNFNLLSYGRTLYVTVGQQSYQYDLTRSEAMLKALGRCASERFVSANPFAGTPATREQSEQANPFAETASNPYRRM
jgi:hypothetical protein